MSGKVPPELARNADVVFDNPDDLVKFLHELNGLLDDASAPRPDQPG
jgi:hypothetical protein